MKTLILLVLGLAAVSAFPKLKNFPRRIPIGSPASPGEFPSLVQIQRYGAQYCLGSIVNSNWIVTASHCSDASASVIGYTVVAGEHNLQGDDGTEQSRSVSQIISHPNYNTNTLANDIAVWKLSSALNLNTFVAPANIPPSSFIPTENVVNAGWGASTPNVLMKVTIPLVTIESCRRTYGQNAILDGMICAGAAGRDLCLDGGAPLYSESYLTGFISWGLGCGRPGYPGVYTYVDYFSDWILSNTA